MVFYSSSWWHALFYDVPYVRRLVSDEVVSCEWDAKRRVIPNLSALEVNDVYILLGSRADSNSYFVTIWTI